MGIYDHAPPSDSAISGRQMDPDAWPIPTSGTVFRSIFRVGAWLTSAENQLQELLTGA